jgi:hypothetical protein
MMAAGLLQRKEYELHPEGPVVLTLRDYDGPKDGNFGPQIEWKFDSPEEREDGEMFAIHYWTGTALSSDPRNKLGKLLTAFGFNIESLDIDALDIDDLIGKKVQAMIVHAADKQGTMRANIDSMVALRKRRPDTDEKAKAVSVAAAGTESGGDRKAADPDWDQPD